MSDVDLERWEITPICRGNRGIDGAWDEAVAQLRQVYDAQLARFGGAVTIVVAIRREPAAGLPSRVRDVVFGAAADQPPKGASE